MELDSFPMQSPSICYSDRFVRPFYPNITQIIHSDVAAIEAEIAKDLDSTQAITYFSLELQERTEKRR